MKSFAAIAALIAIGSLAVVLSAQTKQQDAMFDACFHRFEHAPNVYEICAHYAVTGEAAE